MLLASRAWSESPRPRCPGPQIHLAPELASQRAWVAAVDAVSTRVAQLGKADGCAVLDVHWTGSDATVRASLPDGRFAIRRVSEPKELTPTVVALLALPYPATETSTVRSTPRVETDAAIASAPSPLLVGAPSESALGARAPSELELGARSYPADVPTAFSGGVLHSELSGLDVGLGARAIGGESSVFGLGAAGFATARSGRWLLGLGGHGEKLQQRGANGAPTASATSWSVGIAVGRRLIDGPVSLDLLITPVEVTVTTSTRTVPTSATALALNDNGVLMSGSDDTSADDSSGSDDAAAPTPLPPTTPPVTTPPSPPLPPPTLPQPPATVVAQPSEPATPTPPSAPPPATPPSSPPPPSSVAQTPAPRPVPAPNSQPVSAPVDGSVAQPAQDRVQQNTSTELRMGAALRASARVGGPFRWFAEVNGNVSPTRLAREAQPADALSLMPRWTAGLSIGVLWSPL